MKYFLFSLALLFGVTSAHPQVIQHDTAFLAAAVSNAVRLNTTVTRDHNLYNGSQYIEPVQTSDLHPYFQKEDWTEGWVIYDGDRYENISLIYDILNDKLVTELPNGSFVALVNEKLQQFNIGDHRFVRLVADSVNKGLAKTGFYEILYDGEIKAIHRWEKFKHEKLEDRAVEVEYKEKNRYYIFKNGVYYPVKGKGSVLKVLEDQKGALKQFINRNNLDFKINRDEALAEVAAHYDSLKQKK